MRMANRGALAITYLLAACGTSDPPARPDYPDPEIEVVNDPSGSITAKIGALEAGWHVTTSRLVDHDAPGERTSVSDGTPITLVGTKTDVFVATVTAPNGDLIATVSMKSSCTHASSHQLHVPDEYATIQAAVDAASPGDTVKVAPGTYTESVQLHDGVCLLGSGADRTILDAHGEGRTLVDLTGAPGSVVSGFTIRGAAAKPGCSSTDVFACSGNWYTAGVYLGSESVLGWEDPTIKAPPIIANNIFDGNDVGVMLYFHGIAVVRNNIFVHNRSGFVANHYQDRTLLANNVFADNQELAIGNQAAYLDIIDNIIVRSALGVRFQYIQTGHIECNIFFGNGQNENDDRFMIGSDGNVEVDPHLSPTFHLASGSPAKDHGCHHDEVLDPDGTPPDIGAFGGPLGTWAEL